MARCPKCGNEVAGDMAFCPRCGASLKIEQATTQQVRQERRRNEKAEKGEKREKDEKNEKGEKGEKGEYGFLGPLIGGLVLIFLGIAFYLELTGLYDRRIIWAFFLLLVGVIIIVAALYGVLVLAKRHPRPP